MAEFETFNDHNCFQEDCKMSSLGNKTGFVTVKTWLLYGDIVPKTVRTPANSFTFPTILPYYFSS